MNLSSIRSKTWIWTVLALLGTAPVFADAPAGDHLGLFASAKDIFRPLLADPREIQLALRLVEPVSHTFKGEIALGDYYGLYRWALPWTDSIVQWSIGGGVFSRFDLVTVDKNLEDTDFYANMPLDLRFGKWTTRIMPYHTSSHLGDDYIRQTGIQGSKYSEDTFRLIQDYQPCDHLRLYGGFRFIIRNEYANLGRYALQTGTEVRSKWWAAGHAQTYWANDFQSWERVDWNPEFNSQLGVKIARDPLDRQALSFFLEFGAGHMPQGQFFQQEETHWVFGIRFDIP